MPKCTKCGVLIRSGTLCEIHAVEQRAAGVDHGHEVDRVCAGCGEHAPEGDYSDERRGMWFCPGCSALGLRREERKQLAAESVPVGTDLDRAIRWAVGDDSAYPESDPGECAFVSGNDPRLIADGEGMDCAICGEPIDEDGWVHSRVGEAHEECKQHADLDAGGVA